MNESTKRNEASAESISNLISNCNAHITLHGQTIEGTITLYRICLSLLQDPVLVENEVLSQLKSLCEVVLTYSFAEMENAALLRAELKGRSDNLYRRTLLVQTFRVISESFKALFGFPQTEDQRDSFWAKLSNHFDLSPFTTEIEEINSGLKELISKVLSKEARNIASHYNWDVISVANFYETIDNEDTIIQGINKYLFIIERVSKIANRLFVSFNTESLSHFVASKPSRNDPETNTVWLVEKLILRPDLVNVIRLSYPENQQQLQHCLHLCQYCTGLIALGESKGVKLSANEAAQNYLKILNSVGLMLFMMNDAIASAIALTDSDSYWESRMHLKRLDISAYEVLNKVVGFNKGSKARSLFHMIDLSIDELPEPIRKTYDRLKSNTHSIIRQYEFNNPERRNAFVHFRWYKKVYLLPAYTQLTTINVPSALYKIIELRKLTTEVVNFINSFSKEYSAINDRKFRDAIKAKFNPLREIAEGCGNEESRSLGLKMIDDFQEKLLNLKLLGPESHHQE